MEKAGLIGLVKIRYIESDDNLSLRGDKLKEAIAFDRENGLIPFYVRKISIYTRTMYTFSTVDIREVPIRFLLALRHPRHDRRLRLRQPGGAGTHL